MSARSKIEKKDGTVAIYHCVYENEDFESGAQILVELVRRAQEQCPDQPRILYLDIDSHRNKVGGFDADMLELQKEFLLGQLLPFLTESHAPLGAFRNTKGQRNDVLEKTINTEVCRGQ